MALGAKLWLVRPLGFRLDDRHLRRAGLDYWQHLDWEAVDDWPALVGPLARLPSVVFHASTRATVYTEAAFSPGDVLVFGSESQGLPALAVRRPAGSLSADSDGGRGPQPESGRQRGGGRVRGRPSMRFASAGVAGIRSKPFCLAAASN